MLVLKPYSITKNDVKWSIQNIVFSISPAEIRRAVNNVFLCVTLACIPMEIIPYKFFKRNE
jgi:hypothetical protein